MRKALLFVLVCCAWFFPCSSEELSLKEVDLLFVGYDAGEANIWIQVLDRWNPDLRVAVLTMGTATQLVNDSKVDHIPIEEFNIYCPKNQRNYAFSEQDLKNFSAIECRYVVTGVFSNPQLQIAQHFLSSGAQVIAVWDNFSNFDQLPESLTEFVPDLIKISSVVLTASVDCALDLNKHFNCQKAIAVGQPTLDVWKEKLKAVDQAEALRKILLTPDIPIVLYVGGYQERGNGYQESFDLFAKSLLGLKTTVQVLVQLHPRSDGAYEKAVLDKLARKYPTFPPYFISHPSEHLNTYEAVAISQVGVCHRSTLAIQALFAGKPFLHVDVPDTVFSSFAIEKGLIAQAKCPIDATRFIDNLLSSNAVDASSFYEKAGIVANGTEEMRKFFETICQRRSYPSADENDATPSNR